MRVLLLGSTGRVGSRLLPALLAHDHSVVVYARDRRKLSREVLKRIDIVTEGCATDPTTIKNAILTNQCDAVINAAGRASILGTGGDFANIFSAVTQAARNVQQERKGEPLRCWLLSGWPILDSPKTGEPILSYLNTHLTHQLNYDRIRRIPTSQVAWSLFCASNMPPRSSNIDYTPQPGIAASSLEAAADQPPQWSDSLFSLPFVGAHLNVAAQVQRYFSPLEDCVDFIADDLRAGLGSQWIGRRVGVKVKGVWDVGPWAWVNSVSNGVVWKGAGGGDR